MINRLIISLFLITTYNIYSQSAINQNFNDEELYLDRIIFLENKLSNKNSTIFSLNDLINKKNLIISTQQTLLESLEKELSSYNNLSQELIDLRNDLDMNEIRLYKDYFDKSIEVQTNTNSEVMNGIGIGLTILGVLVGILAIIGFTKMKEMVESSVNSLTIKMIEKEKTSILAEIKNTADAETAQLLSKSERELEAGLSKINETYKNKLLSFEKVSEEALLRSQEVERELKIIKEQVLASELKAKVSSILAEGFEMQSNGNHDSAIENFKLANEIKESDRANFGIGFSLISLGDYNSALKYFFKAVKPNYKGKIEIVYVNIAHIYMKLNKLAEAKKYLKMAIEKNPKYDIALYNWLCVSSLEGNVEKSKQYLTMLAKTKSKKFTYDFFLKDSDLEVVLNDDGFITLLQKLYK